MTTPNPSPEPSPKVAPARMPALFVGHGSPMNAIEDNVWSRGFRALGAELPRPRVVVSISAHWFVGATMVTGNPRPETIHDFDGFPPALYEMRYPAPGDAELAERLVKLLGKLPGGGEARLSQDWGLDHGTWSVLHYLLPKADVPVIQLSLDAHLAPAGHLEIGKHLASLRDDGVLVMGSGNITHNLRYAMTASYRGDTSLPAWANSFDADVTTALGQHDLDFLARAVSSDAGRMSHPTLDHYLPLLYAAAAGGQDAVSFPISGFDLGSLSMRSVLFG